MLLATAAIASPRMGHVITPISSLQGGFSNPPIVFYNQGSLLGVSFSFNCSTGTSCSFINGQMTITATGSGGSGCVPPGVANSLLYDNGTGGCLDLPSLGTTSTVLHGNAAGLPTFGKVVSADLNITTSACTNQFLTAISAAAAGTCTTASLASTQFANQGTATTVLHGNAAGNPAFGSVVLSTDVSGQLPIAAVGSSGLSGTSPIAISAAGAISCTTCNVSSATVSSVVIAGTANQVTVGGTCTITTTGTCTLSLPNAVILGTDNSAAGTVQLANPAAAAHTIFTSGATTTNTIAGFTVVPTTGHVVTCTVVSTTCTLTDGGAPGTGTVSSVATTAPITGGTFTTTGTIGCATCATGPGASTSTDLASFNGTGGIALQDSGIASGNVVTAASAAAAAAQICTASGASKTCTYIDFPDVKEIPAANCNNTSAGNGWSIGSGGTVSCRTGTNNLGGFAQISDVTSTFATFQIDIPEDWDSSTTPYIRVKLASTDATNAHTVIPSESVACYKGDGSTTDDVAPNATRSLSTVTLNGNANRFWSTSNLQLNSTDMTGCAAGATMQFTIGRATDTATAASVRFYSATVTFLRLPVMQAN